MLPLLLSDHNFIVTAARTDLPICERCIYLSSSFATGPDLLRKKKTAPYESNRHRYRVFLFFWSFGSFASSSYLPHLGNSADWLFYRHSSQVRPCSPTQRIIRTTRDLIVPQRSPPAHRQPIHTLLHDSLPPTSAFLAVTANRFVREACFPSSPQSLFSEITATQNRSQLRTTAEETSSSRDTRELRLRSNRALITLGISFDSPSLTFSRPYSATYGGRASRDGTSADLGRSLNSLKLFWILFSLPSSCPAVYSLSASRPFYFSCRHFPRVFLPCSIGQEEKNQTTRIEEGKN